MNNHLINIVIVEPSQIVFEGLSNILHRSGIYCQVFQIDDLDEITVFINDNNPEIIIINPILIQNRLKTFKAIKKNTRALWVALVYNFFDNEMLFSFEGIIRITDKQDDIIEMIDKIRGHDGNNKEASTQEQLSERETEVLIQLVNGLSNKEIADKLNISIHTVISHRKNITQKTGIKSQSGLTIYAISNKIILLDNLLQ